MRVFVRGMIGRLPLLVLALALAGCALPKDRPLAMTLRLADPTASHSPADLDAAETVLEERLELLGVDGVVERPDDQTFVVRLPGDADVAGLEAVLAGPGVLEFVDPLGVVHAEGELICTTNARPAGADCATVYATVVDGSGLDRERVELTEDMSGRTAVFFAFKEPAATALGDFTATIVGQPMTIVLDGRVISSPVVQDRLPGEGIVTFGAIDSSIVVDRQAKRLVALLKSGRMPVALEVAGVEGQP